MSQHPPSSANFDPLASQPDRPSSYAPQQTPPSTEHLFSSSAFHLSSSQLDPNPNGRRARGRNELGDRTRYLEGVEELISEGEHAAAGIPAASNEPVKVIWGTHTVITETIATFKSFLRNFSLAQRHLYEHQSDSGASIPMLDDSILAADLEPYYPKLLKKVCNFHPIWVLIIFLDSRHRIVHFEFGLHQFVGIP